MTQTLLEGEIELMLPSSSSVEGALLKRAAAEVLACPRCSGTFHYDEDVLSCVACHERYPIVDGVPQLRVRESVQQNELSHRDRIAREHAGLDRESLLDAIGRHHSVPAMRDYVDRFLATFRPGDWIIDLGVGWGWHWASISHGPYVLALDLSHENLHLARRLVTPKRVVLICADAMALPVRSKTLVGAWTVQMLEHLPPNALVEVVSELNRVLRSRSRVEYHGRNVGAVQALRRRLARWRTRGSPGRSGMEPHRGTAQRFVDAWGRLSRGPEHVEWSWSELFFHPSLRLRPRHYPMRLERAVARYFPFLARVFARQVRVRITDTA